MRNKYGVSKWVWGTFMLLAAAFVLSNQFGGFMDIGVGSIIVAALSLAFIVQCIARLSFSPLPLPLAVLYYVFQEPLGFPYIKLWTLLLAAFLATIGLFALLPRRFSREHTVHIGYHGNRTSKHKGECDPEEHIEDGGNENNPSVSVSFGSVSRYLHADCLETAQLYCNFGALEVFFDKAQPSPEGATVSCNCSFGGMTLFIPKHWHVIDNLNCTLGGVEMDNRFATPTENAPQITLEGSVLLGGIEIRLI